MKAKQQYFDNDQFLEELEKWRSSAEDVNERVPSEKLGKLLIDLHDGILKHPNFRNYRQDLKEEMKSYSIYRILKCGLKTFKFGGKSTPFSYFTRSVFLNYYTVLARYYQRINNHEEYLRNCLTKLEEQGLLTLKSLLKRFESDKKSGGREENNK